MPQSDRVQTPLQCDVRPLDFHSALLLQVLMALHNMAYQGAFGAQALASLSISPGLFHFLEDRAADGWDDSDSRALEPEQSGMQVEAHAGHSEDGVGDAKACESTGKRTVAQQAARPWQAAVTSMDGVRPTSGARSSPLAVHQSRRHASTAVEHSNNAAAHHGQLARDDPAEGRAPAQSAQRLWENRPSPRVTVSASLTRQNDGAPRKGFPAAVPLQALEVMIWQALLGELCDAIEHDSGGALAWADGAVGGMRAEKQAHGKSEGADDKMAGGGGQHSEGLQDHGELWRHGTPLEARQRDPDRGPSGHAEGGGVAVGTVRPGGSSRRRDGVQTQEVAERARPEGLPQRSGAGGDAGTVPHVTEPTAGEGAGGQGVGMGAGDQCDSGGHSAQSLQHHTAASRPGRAQRNGKASGVAADVEAVELSSSLPDSEVDGTCLPGRSGSGASAAAQHERAAIASSVGSRSYLGLWPLWIWDRLCISAEQSPPERAGGFRGAINWLRAGLRTAAALVTVSPAYAREVCSVQRACRQLPFAFPLGAAHPSHAHANVRPGHTTSQQHNLCAAMRTMVSSSSQGRPA